MKSLDMLYVKNTSRKAGIFMIGNTHKHAKKAIDFLNSIGVNSSVNVRAETLEQTISCIQYTGIHWIRTGYEGGICMEDLVRLNAETGVKVSYGLLSGGADIDRLIWGAEKLAVTIQSLI